MAVWNPNKKPETFPVEWHRAILGGPGEYCLGVARTPVSARHIRKRFSGFLASLRNYPFHQTAQVLESLHTRTRVVVNAVGDYEVWVKVQKKLFQEHATQN